ncbi:TorF family putative porin [Gimibacter soli]|uniref:TorF family putative porin n=1 Tax=Gimibacter soli TaxID=3024400 RepID=A0AAE9XUU6_9PROT|nr:TorF family putative porin [Gimibacter soli]WCL53199.1 TorF family putative porin [Gimibacter soli]
MPTLKLRRSLVPLVLIASAAAVAPSAAMADDEPYFSLSANASLVSEYRFRGLSLSEKDPAIQGGFDVSTKDGFYIGAWGSSIEGYGTDTGGLSELELDIYAGYATEIGAGLTADIGVLAYTYPGSDGTHYVEAYGSISGNFAELVDWKLGAAYVWGGQANLTNQDNIYVYLDAGVPIKDTPITATGHIAYEDGAFGDGKWDWNLGLEYAFEQYSVSVQYVDTNVDGIGAAAAVFGLHASF